MINLLIILSSFVISIHTNEFTPYTADSSSFLSQVDLDAQLMIDSHLIPCEFLINNYWFDIKPLANEA